MFKKPFSFEGRIRRTEYGLTVLINSIGIHILVFILLVISRIIEIIIVGGADNHTKGHEEIGNMVVMIIGILLYILSIIFGIAQGVKRCHDLGHSGLYMLIPFYIFFLLFIEGNTGSNKYGEDPKQLYQPQNLGNTGYTGGYNGGYSQTTPTDNNEHTQTNSGGFYNGGHNARINIQTPQQPNRPQRDKGEFNGNLYN